MQLRSGASYACLFAGLLLGSPSHAQAPPPAVAPATSAPASARASEPAPAPAPAAGPFSGSLTLVSQYVERGLRQTYDRPAIQLELDYTHASGLFVGTALSNVSSKDVDNAFMEWDLYGGYKHEWHGVRYGTTYYLYFYPGAHTSDATGRTRYTYSEVIPSIGYRFLTVNYAVTVSQDYFGYNGRTLGGDPRQHSRYSAYLDVNGNFELLWGVSALVHYGFQNVRNFKQANYQDARLALSRTFADVWIVGVAFSRAWDIDNYYNNYTNTEPGSPASNPLKNTYVAWVTRSFAF